MSRLPVLIKGFTALIFLLPLGLVFLHGAVPVNISKGVLLVSCELAAAVTALMSIIGKKKLMAKLRGRLLYFVAVSCTAMLVLFISLVFFSARYTSRSEFGDKVLLPMQCSGDLCLLQQIAKKKSVEIAAHLGKDRLVAIINQCCKPGLVKAEIIYDALLVLLFADLFFLLLVLGIIYSENDRERQLAILRKESLGANYDTYVKTYLEKQSGLVKGVKFHVFISYSSGQREKAENLYHALLNNNYMVFFDRGTLPEGKEYNMAIHDAVNCSDMMLFFISPDAVAQGRYTLTELEYATKRWMNASGKILPVMIEDTPYKDIPAYVKSVTVFTSKGNIVAELVAEVERMYQQRNIS